ncbi:MAG: tRNA pseudouridine(55) synthase, partial [Desulfovibrionaceae bacterium]|nr:tRNA pseudouridine(55) synthase [Desulfovibrionaceae bacterium]
REVKIFKAELLDYQHPFLKVRVECSSGTYIRSLAHSLGNRLGCGAVLTQLEREYSYPFGLKSAVNLEDLESNPKILLHGLHPIKKALPDWPCFTVSDLWAKAVRNGQPLPQIALPEVAPNQTKALLMYEGCELALVSLGDSALGPCWKVTRGLWNDINF